MNRPEPTPGKLAVAASAAIAILALTSRTAPAQQVGGSPAPDQAKAAASNVTAELETKRAARAVADVRAAAVEVEVRLQAGQPIVAQRVVVAPNPEQLARQTLEQLRPAFERELRLLTSATGPTPTQRREIAIEAGRSLRRYVEATANRDATQRRIQISLLLNDPNVTVRNFLLVGSKEKLSNPQCVRYWAELDRKEADRKEVGVLNIVANLDGKLHLSSKQREQLCESIRKYWDARECPALEYSGVYDLYAPLLSDATILPFLDEHQGKIWRTLAKYHLGPMRAPNLVNPVLALEFDDQDRDEDVMAAFGEEVKK